MKRSPNRRERTAKRFEKPLAIALLMAVVMQVAGAQAQWIVPAQSRGVGNAAWEEYRPAIAPKAPLLARALPAIVTILVTKKQKAAVCEIDSTTTHALGFVDEVMRIPGLAQRFSGRSNPRQALGSGFLIDPSGFIVTSNRLIRHAAAIVVRMHDGTEHTARMSARDPKTDLALLKLDARPPLPYLKWGDSGRTKAGDWLIALGSPYGLADAARIARVGAVGRALGFSSYDDFLQVGGAIASGDAGGPDLDLDGKVVGVNMLMYAPESRPVGIAFAIPSNLARLVIDQLLAQGKVTRSWMGAAVQDVTPEIAYSLGLPKAQGAIVNDVVDGGPAARAGLKQGDVITALNGQDGLTARALPLLVARLPIGKTATLHIWRAGHDATLRIVTLAMPRDAADFRGFLEAGSREVRPLGVTLGSVDDATRRQFHLSKDVRGVIITAIAPDSPLAAADIAPCDIIETIDGKPIATPDQAALRFKEALRIADRYAPLLLLNRRGIRWFMATPLRPSDQEECCSDPSAAPIRVDSHFRGDPSDNAVTGRGARLPVR